MDLKFESSWWGNCCNTYGEETKQLVYAKKMGLKIFHDGKSPYNIDVANKAVIDIGGGPCSLLLKSKNTRGVIIDPCAYPDWVNKRYESANIQFCMDKAEDLDLLELGEYDECWIYNCLQHTDDPEKIINNTKRISKIIRIFEWVDNGVSEGHPQDLKEELLNKWLGGTGKVEYINEGGCVGKCYYGIFKGDLYEKI